MNFLSSFQTLFLGLFFIFKLALSKKHGLVEITASNYQSLVIDGDKDAWIVAVKGAGKISLDEWKETESNLRGLLVRVGIIDPKKHGAFLKRKVRIAENTRILLIIISYIKLANATESQKLSFFCQNFYQKNVFDAFLFKSVSRI